MVCVALSAAEFTFTAIIPTPPVDNVPLLASKLNPPLPDPPPLTEICKVYVVPGLYDAGWPLIDTVTTL